MAKASIDLAAADFPIFLKSVSMTGATNPDPSYNCAKTLMKTMHCDRSIILSSSRTANLKAWIYPTKMSKKPWFITPVCN